MTSEPLVLHTRVVTGAGGGPEKTILNSPRFMEERGYRMICVYMRDPGNGTFAQLEERARERGARLIAVDDRGPLDWRILASFRDICREYRPAIWHGHDYKSNFLGLLLRRSLPIRLVTTVHGWVQRTWKTPLYYAIDRSCLRRYEAVVCVSRDIHRACLKLGVPEARSTYLPNAIDLEEFRRVESPAAAKLRLGVPSSRMILGAVGRLSPEKGFDLLVAAFAEMCSAGLDGELWIAGEGGEKKSLVAQAARLGIGERVRWLGYQNDLLDLYHAMDVFVLSSLREGLPNVLLEAMALELPVLCTRVAGVPSLVRTGVNGLVIEPGSAAALADGLKTLIGDPSLRARLGASARATVEESFDFRSRMASIQSIYDSLLADGNGAERPPEPHASF